MGDGIGRGTSRILDAGHVHGYWRVGRCGAWLSRGSGCVVDRDVGYSSNSATGRWLWQPACSSGGADRSIQSSLYEVEPAAVNCALSSDYSSGWDRRAEEAPRITRPDEDQKTDTLRRYASEHGALHVPFWELVRS